MGKISSLMAVVAVVFAGSLVGACSSSSTTTTSAPPAPAPASAPASTAPVARG